jgi:hypothetical protein
VRRSDGGFVAVGILPLPLQFVIATIAYAINERMARRIDYLMEEVLLPRTVPCSLLCSCARYRLPVGEDSICTSSIVASDMPFGARKRGSLGFAELG